MTATTWTMRLARMLGDELTAVAHTQACEQIASDIDGGIGDAVAAIAALPLGPRRDPESHELGPVSADLIPYLTVRSKFDKATRRPGQRHTGTWSEIASMLTQHAVLPDKDRALGFVPLTMVDAPCTCGKKDCPGELGHLRAENVVAFSMLILDLDKYRDDSRQLDQAGAERAMARLRELNVRHFVYSTFSHSYPDHASLRVGVALSRPVTVEEWTLFFPAVTAWLDVEHDPACSGTVGRFWYMPAHPPGAEPIAYVVDGDPIDVDAIMERARAAEAAKPPRESVRPRQRYTPRGDEFDIRAAMATSHPDVRTEDGGGNTAAEWHIGGARCPNTAAHTSPNGRTDTTVCLLVDGRWGFSCLHSHCEHLDHDDFRKHIQPDWKPYDPNEPKRSDREPPSHVTRDRDPEPAVGAPMPDPPPDSPAALDAPPPASETYRIESRHPNAPKLPKIQISTKMVPVVDAAQDALLQRGGIYVRGRKLVRVVRDWSAPKWLRIPDGLPVIAELGETALCEQMSAAADWEKFDARSGEWKPALPPNWAAKALKERGQWSFPVLEGISEAPVLRLDGTVHDTPGYDPESRYIFAPGDTTWSPLKRKPTRDDARAAYKALAEPFCDVPFLGESDRAAAISLILSIVGRAAIAGPVPGYEVGASTPGAGKGLTLDVASIIATGRSASKMAPTRDDSEMRKRLLPIALSGRRSCASTTSRASSAPRRSRLRSRRTHFASANSVSVRTASTSRCAPCSRSPGTTSSLSATSAAA